MARYDHRSAEARQWRKLYNTGRWRRLRIAKLSADPICEYCLRTETIEPATVVHHGDGGHKGDIERFWSGPFVSLCKRCHDTYGADEDAGREVRIIGADGYPV